MPRKKLKGSNTNLELLYLNLPLYGRLTSLQNKKNLTATSTSQLRKKIKNSKNIQTLIDIEKFNWKIFDWIELGEYLTKASGFISELQNNIQTSKYGKPNYVLQIIKNINQYFYHEDFHLKLSVKLMNLKDFDAIQYNRIVNSLIKFKITSSKINESIEFLFDKNNKHFTPENINFSLKYIINFNVRTDILDKCSSFIESNIHKFSLDSLVKTYRFINLINDKRINNDTMPLIFKSLISNLKRHIKSEKPINYKTNELLISVTNIIHQSSKFEIPAKLVDLIKQHIKHNLISFSKNQQMLAFEFCKHFNFEDEVPEILSSCLKYYVVKGIPLKLDSFKFSVELYKNLGVYNQKFLDYSEIYLKKNIHFYNDDDFVKLIDLFKNSGQLGTILQILGKNLSIFYKYEVIEDDTSDCNSKEICIDENSAAKEVYQSQDLISFEGDSDTEFDHYKYYIKPQKFMNYIEIALQINIKNEVFFNAANQYLEYNLDEFNIEQIKIIDKLFSKFDSYKEYPTLARAICEQFRDDELLYLTTKIILPNIKNQQDIIDYNHSNANKDILAFIRITGCLPLEIREKIAIYTLYNCKEHIDNPAHLNENLRNKFSSLIDKFNNNYLTGLDLKISCKKIEDNKDYVWKFDKIKSEVKTIMDQYENDKADTNKPLIFKK